MQQQSKSIADLRNALFTDSATNRLRQSTRL